MRVAGTVVGGMEMSEAGEIVTYSGRRGGFAGLTRGVSSVLREHDQCARVGYALHRDTQSRRRL